MYEGTVKWFKEDKGYGFIGIDGAKDVFVHYTGIQRNGKERRNLEAGQKVRFDIVEGQKGLQAADVQVIG